MGHSTASVSRTMTVIPITVIKQCDFRVSNGPGDLVLATLLRVAGVKANTSATLTLELWVSHPGPVILHLYAFCHLVHLALQERRSVLLDIVMLLASAPVTSLQTGPATWRMVKFAWKNQMAKAAFVRCHKSYPLQSLAPPKPTVALLTFRKPSSYR